MQGVQPEHTEALFVVLNAPGPQVAQVRSEVEVPSPIMYWPGIHCVR